MHDLQTFFWNCSHDRIVCIFQLEDELDVADTPVALLTIVTDNATAAVHFSPESVSVVVEDGVFVSDLPFLADAFVLLFGLTYALHLDYLKKLSHTFTFIQKIVMCLDDGKPLKLPC